MKEAFAALSDGRAVVPQRAHLPITPNRGISLFMPAFVDDPYSSGLRGPGRDCRAFTGGCRRSRTLVMGRSALAGQRREGFWCWESGALDRSRSRKTSGGSRQPRSLATSATT